MRIHVTGNAGAGKTTLARRLGSALGLPVIHLDQIVWQSGWRTTPQDQQAASLRSAVAPRSWVIEGVSGFVRERADIVVFLDVPRRVCLWRCLMRNWRYSFRSRPELPHACPEILVVPQLLRIIWRFPALVGTQIHEEALAASKYQVIRHQSNLEQWLHEFTAAQAA